jgi:hypothetical protein
MSEKDFSELAGCFVFLSALFYDIVSFESKLPKMTLVE